MTNIIEATPMAHKLRKYQKEAVYRVINGDGKNQMIQLPAGAGKTVVAGKICNHYLKEGKKILFLVHRKELAKQAKSEFMQKYEIDSSFIIANHRQDLSAGNLKKENTINKNVRVVARLQLITYLCTVAIRTKIVRQLLL